MACLADLVATFCLGLSGLLMFHLWASTRRKTGLGRLQMFLGQAVAETRSRSMAPISLPEGLKRRLDRAGLHPSQSQASLVAAISIAAVPLVCATVGSVAGFLAVVSLVVVAWLVLEWRVTQRHKAISDCMLSFLERMRQFLVVGNSLAVALARAAENSPPIMAESVASTLRRIDNGSGVAESLERCAEELDLYEMHLLATAARTNLRFGGSMTATLRNIVENIHRRSAIERELRANTTQIRTSAWVLGLLPILIATLVMLTNRGYSQWFLSNRAGHAMILYAVVSQLLGVWCMRLIAKTRY